MAPPSEHHHHGAVDPSHSASPPEPHRPLPTPFLSKAYQIVDDPEVDDVISWSPDGSAFVVWRPAEFARDLLPKYFKHNNFSSFVRQLNTYGFRKVVADRWEFANDCFRRGEKRLLCDIQRRKIAQPPPPQPPLPAAPSVSSSDSGDPPPRSVSSPAADLAGENERLRRENMSLSRELSQMRALCDNIVMLLSSYAGGASGKVAASAAAALELMPTRRLEGGEDVPEPRGGGARLFGVQIGGKRMRVEAERAAPLDPAVVKREPLDHRIGDGEEETCDLRVCH